MGGGCGPQGGRAGKCAFKEGDGVDPKARDSGAEKREGACVSYSPIYLYIVPSIINGMII